MPTPILQTKLYIPPPRPKLVPRVCLIERLNEGLHRKLTLIAAQTGAGKTTLVSRWIDQLDHAVAWLSAEEADSEPTRFWLYVIAALQTVRPELGRAAQTMLEAPSEPSLEILLTNLINEVATAPDRIMLVLDDYHLYEQNDLAGAEQHLRQAVACGELIGDWSMTRRGLLPLSWLEQMRGNTQEAEDLWQRALTVRQLCCWR